MRKLTALAVGAVLIGWLAAGCATTVSPNEAASFWSGLRTEPAEVNPPQDLDDLVDRVKIVVTGRIVKVSPGPGADAGYSPEETIAQLTVMVDKVLEGNVSTDRIEVIVPRQPLVSPAQLDANIPDQQLMLFLVPLTYKTNYYSITTNKAIIAESKTGPETVLEPESSEAITGKTGSLDELSTEVRAQVES